MYRGTALRCPACTGHLDYARTSLVVHACGSCGGMWLGPDAAVHLLRAGGDGLQREIVSSAERASSIPPAPGIASAVIPDNQTRRCPACDLEMSPLMVGKVRIDSCPAHGTWFDRHEIQLVIDSVDALKKKANGPEETPALELLQGSVMLLVGAVKVSFNVVADLLWRIYMAPRGHSLVCGCPECDRFQ